jgi:hypothetical protein
MEVIIMKEKSVIKAMFVCLFTLLLMVPFCIAASDAGAATHYVSPTGSATWANSTNISTPTSIATAFANASAGDLVYLRGGTYNMGTTVLTLANSGTGTADAQRIIFRAYTGETPDIVTNVSGVPHSDNAGAFVILQNYVTIDGITMHTTAGSAEFNSCIEVGYDYGCTGVKIINCNLNLVYATSVSNIAVIQFHTVTNGLIQNNTLTGYRWSGGGTMGIQLWNGTGNKVLNNVISTNDLGIMQKHPNCDNSLSSGAEIAYNYAYNNRRAGLYGRYRYTSIHDNIFAGDATGLDLGDDGGGSCTDGYALLNHNTFVNQWMDTGTGMPNATFTNNIVTTNRYWEGSSHATNVDYNIYGSAAAIGSHDRGNTSVTFTGGATPSTIAGFTLTSGSSGHNAASDGTDMGANVSLVGTGKSGGSSTSAPSAPSLL